VKELEILGKTVHFLKNDKVGLKPFCSSGPEVELVVRSYKTHIYTLWVKRREVHTLLSGLYSSHLTVKG